MPPDSPIVTSLTRDGRNGYDDGGAGVGCQRNNPGIGQASNGSSGRSAQRHQTCPRAGSGGATATPLSVAPIRMSRTEMAMQE